MESSLYKDLVTSRGVKYHYYYSPARAGTHTLLFCHGFPSTSQDWRKMVPYFKERGYGIIAPDMLGYSGTDRPTDPAMYVWSAMTKDLVDILDAEKVDKVVAVGHDWGTMFVSRLASWCPEKVIAYAFLGLAYAPPWPKDLTFEDYVAQIKQITGYELFGYWYFFNRDDVDKIIQDHLPSFVSILWPHDLQLWVDRLAITGGFEKTLLEDWIAPMAPYATEQDKENFVKTFRANGFSAPTCWYKATVRGINPADDTKIPPELAYPHSTCPIFFGAATNDRICTPALGYAMFKNEHFKECQITSREYEADHWLILSHADGICRDVEAWITGFAL